MSHCAPEATLKPERFEFTLKTVITDVFVEQVYWEAVPKTWPGGSNKHKVKVHVAKCVVRITCITYDSFVLVYVLLIYLINMHRVLTNGTSRAV